MLFQSHHSQLLLLNFLMSQLLFLLKPLISIAIVTILIYLKLSFSVEPIDFNFAQCNYM
jgi:hypothetical protein